MRSWPVLYFLGVGGVVITDITLEDYIGHYYGYQFGGLYVPPCLD